MKWPMLMLRGRTYYSRIAVPLALQPLLKRKEVWKSLRTSDPREAQVLSLKVSAEVLRLFQALRKRASARATDPVSIANTYAARVRSSQDDGDAETLSLVYSDALETFHEALEQGDTSRINRLLDEVLLEEGLHVPPAQRPAYAEALLKAHVSVLKEKLRDAPAGPTVTDLLDAYLRERKLPAKTDAETRAIYERFEKVIGGGSRPAAEVSKADVRAYREHLFNSPSKRSGDGKFAPNSVKKHLGAVATVFRFAVAQGLLERSAFEGGLTRVVRATTERRLPYEADDLRALFKSEAFKKLTGTRRWLPLLGLYTGARLEELGGLRVQDVREADGVPYLDFVPTPERKLKNAGSQRKVPLHPDLVRMGFLEWVRQQPQGGMLFHDLKAGRFGKFTGPLSNWWARYSDGCGVTDQRKTFHSLRHAFKDACRAAGVPEEIHDRLTGHTSGSVGRRYGLGQSLPVLAGAMGRITFGIEDVR